MESAESWPSGLDEPDFTLDEINPEVAMAEIVPGPVSCCYSDSHCACLPHRTECCTENVENDDEHYVPVKESIIQIIQIIGITHLIRLSHLVFRSLPDLFATISEIR